MDVKRRDVLKGAAAVAASAATVGGAAIISSTPSYAQQVDAAKKWVDSEFQPSTLSKDEQMAEMEWFIKASAPFKGMKLSTVSEILSIHDYESKTLTKAFAEITGIQVNHELLDEGKLVDKIEVEIAVRQADLRLLDERFRLHRHASPLQRHRRRIAYRFHGQRRQGRHQSGPRPQGFHRSVLRDIHRWEALSTARSAVRQSLLVPLRLVPEAGAQGGVQGEIWLRSRRARQLVGL